MSSHVISRHFGGRKAVSRASGARDESSRLSTVRYITLDDDSNGRKAGMQTQPVAQRAHGCSMLGVGRRSDRAGVEAHHVDHGQRGPTGRVLTTLDTTLHLSCRLCGLPQRFPAHGCARVRPSRHVLTVAQAGQVRVEVNAEAGLYQRAEHHRRVRLLETWYALHRRVTCCLGSPLRLVPAVRRLAVDLLDAHRVDDAHAIGAEAGRKGRDGPASRVRLQPDEVDQPLQAQESSARIHLDLRIEILHAPPDGVRWLVAHGPDELLRLARGACGACKTEAVGLHDAR